MIEFQKYPKTPRLFRNAVITEKLDGTNSGVQIVGLGDALDLAGQEAIFSSSDGALEYAKIYGPKEATWATVDGVHYAVVAQSRNRLITPSNDNHGFAGWVWDNVEMLVRTLGPGLHFGEWWGQGIQRRYGLDYKKFSLFNVSRWGDLEVDSPSKHLGVVPTLYEGRFSEDTIRDTLEYLRVHGSVAAPGFTNPEGVITFHKDSGQTFKTTLVDDEEPKGARR